MYIQVAILLYDVMCICSVSIFANSRAQGNTDQGGVEPPQSCCQSCKLCESNATPKGQLVLCMLCRSCGSNGQLCCEHAKSSRPRQVETPKQVIKYMWGLKEICMYMAYKNYVHLQIYFLCMCDNINQTQLIPGKKTLHLGLKVIMAIKPSVTNSCRAFSPVPLFSWAPVTFQVETRFPGESLSPKKIRTPLFLWFPKLVLLPFPKPC